MEHPGTSLRTSRRWISIAIAAAAIIFVAFELIGGFAGHAPEHAPAPAAAPAEECPELWSVIPFAALLLAIAILPLIPGAAHWWENNRRKLLLALLLGLVTLLYYFLVHPQAVGRGAEPGAGLGFVLHKLDEAVLEEYIPFIVLLFSLYVISGGIHLRGDLPAHPITNVAFIGTGTLLASFIGTTGASMLLIRPLLQTNSERRHVIHTVIFFIFLVSNIGGCLLPIGDPPLFLGYLRGVPFEWTLTLWKEWALTASFLLFVYFLLDSFMYHREAPRDIVIDEIRVRRITLEGKVNIIWLLGVVLAVAFLVPEKKILGYEVPPFLREVVQLLLVVVSLWTTSIPIREANRFNYVAIAEVAALFIGIFITMQAPIDLLRAKGGEIGLQEPWHFFWATGIVSSFLDNAPTYKVYFETAASPGFIQLVPAGTEFLAIGGGGKIAIPHLTAISLGAVFMGANTYIGNGPNFMVKAIAEQSGVRMPSFFGYMLRGAVILLPAFVVVTFIFLV